MPLSQRLSEVSSVNKNFQRKLKYEITFYSFQGPDGKGSDSGAILGPIIQLIAPLIGPLSGPLIGPLSRTSSGVRILFRKTCYCELV